MHAVIASVLSHECSVTKTFSDFFCILSDMTVPCLQWCGCILKKVGLIRMEWELGEDVISSENTKVSEF